MEHDTINTESPETVAAAAPAQTTGPRVMICTPSVRWRTFALLFLLLGVCAMVLAMLGTSTGMLDVNIDGTPLHGVGAMAVAVVGLAIGLLAAMLALAGVTVAAVVGVVLLVLLLVAALLAAVSPLLAPVIVLIVLIKWLAKR